MTEPSAAEFARFVQEAQEQRALASALGVTIAQYREALVRYGSHDDECLHPCWCGLEVVLASPDRLDALVWALTELMVGAPPPAASAEVPPARDSYHAARPRRL